MQLTHRDNDVCLQARLEYLHRFVLFQLAMDIQPSRDYDTPAEAHNRPSPVPK